MSANAQTTNDTIRLLVTIDVQSQQQKNLMFTSSAQNTVGELLKKLNGSISGTCQTIYHAPEASGEKFEVAHAYKVKDSFRDMDRVYVTATNSGASKAVGTVVKQTPSVKQMQKTKPQEKSTKEAQLVVEKKEERSPEKQVQIDTTINKNKARRLRKQMEKMKEQKQAQAKATEAKQEQARQDAAAAEAKKASEAAAQAKRDSELAAQAKRVSEAAATAAIQAVVPPIQMLEDKIDTPRFPEPLKQTTASAEKPAQTPKKLSMAERTPKKEITQSAIKAPATPASALSKNAKRKLARKQQEESAEQLRAKIYESINSYSQDEAVKSISENEEGSKLSGNGAQSFIQDLTNLNTNKSGSSSEVSSFGSVGKL